MDLRPSTKAHCESVRRECLDSGGQEEKSTQSLQLSLNELRNIQRFSWLVLESRFPHLFPLCMSKAASVCFEFIHQTHSQLETSYCSTHESHAVDLVDLNSCDAQQCATCRSKRFVALCIG